MVGCVGSRWLWYRGCWRTVARRPDVSHRLALSDHPPILDCPGPADGAELAGGVKPAAVTGREQRDCFLLAVEVARDNEPRVVRRRRTSGLDGQLRAVERSM